MKPARRTRQHRRIRIRLTVASFVLSALIVAGAVAGTVAVLHVEIGATIQARLEDRTAAVIAAIDTTGGTVHVEGADDVLLDMPNWVFSTDGTQLLGSRLHGSVGAEVRRLSTVRRTTTATTGFFRLLATPITAHGRTIAVAVAAVDEAPYDATLDDITRDAVLLGVLAVLGATGLAALVLWRSLGPIAEMTERASEWSRLRSDSRFALGPPRDELTGLAAVLDDLLDRVQAALTAERRLTAEIAHELRSPLTLLIGETDLALMNPRTDPAERERYTRIHDAATTMARAITALLDDASAAAEGDADSDVADAVHAVAANLDPRITVQVSGPDVRARVPFIHLERMLAPVLDNAVAAATSRVAVAIRPEGEAVLASITDDGPGVDPDVATTLFEPGVTTRASGTGLGLALARRLVLEVGGDLRLAELHPATFELRLPRVLEPVPSRPARAARS